MGRARYVFYWTHKILVFYFLSMSGPKSIWHNQMVKYMTFEQIENKLLKHCVFSGAFQHIYHDNYRANAVFSSVISINLNVFFYLYNWVASCVSVCVCVCVSTPIMYIQSKKLFTQTSVKEAHTTNMIRSTSTGVPVNHPLKLFLWTKHVCS